jgi:hypothetical protein
MGDGGLAPRQPLGLDEVVRLFTGFPHRWWVSGGHALELHQGRTWRAHEDSDVSVLREDSAALRDVLAGWDIQVAAVGTLSPWAGSAVLAHASQNNLWCRTSADEPWCLDVTISDGDEEFWIYRRDRTVRMPWDEAVLRSERGDDVDAHEVIPELAEDRRRRLRDVLPEDHPWRGLLAQ